MFRVRAALLPEGLREDVVVEHQDGEITGFRYAREGDPEPLDGLLTAGLVNAHTHLELSALGLIPGGSFLAWFDGLMQAGHGLTAEQREQAGRDAAKTMFAQGHAVVCDISNRGDTAPWLLDAGLSGVVQHEHLGLDRAALPDILAEVLQVGEVARVTRAVVHTRPAPHAPTSTAPALIALCARAPGHAVPASMHVAETRGELQFLEDRTGPFARILDQLRRDWRWWEAPGVSPVAYLSMLGVLSDLMVVHGVHMSALDRQILRDAGSTLCLCPRSNRHIEGELPDAEALVAAGIPLALGTDSLASCEDLDVLGDAALLLAHAPAVVPETWLRAATRGGAQALRMEEFGDLTPGTAPGLLFFEGVGDCSAALTAPRRWLAPPRARLG